MKYFLTILIFGCLSCAPPSAKHVDQKFIENKDIEIVSLTREGLSSYTNSRFEEAEEKFREALKLAPNDENIQFSLSLSLSAQEKYDGAESLLSNLVNNDKESIKFKRALANNYFLQDESDKAISLLQDAYELTEAAKQKDTSVKTIEPKVKADRLLVSRELVKIYFKEKEYNSALKYSESAFELSKTVKELEVYTRNLIALQDLEKAKTVIEEFPTSKDPKFLLLKSLVYLGVEDFEKSFEASKRALDLVGGKPILNQAEVTLICIASNDMGALEIEEEDFQVKKVSELFNGKPLESELVEFWPSNLRNWLKDLTRYNN